ncbi:hypothetical protein AJ80_01063 [Polytolypa hystricis UAMH7299]|uniref:Ubiquitin carboxyl-terminal hydrolase n=1 Tax=Polytolypa hystricis (strain UAMH7299) TaxID=1447883 RepID=A0A2B7Z203_POLH7|nr:hypothetical protein AJ80_01063 [Polytolypa hystricis UAMH7299]
MGSFFVKLRGNAASNTTAAVAQPKKDVPPPPKTPLEKMLSDSGPVRSDGSDKFFGMENYGNTCYCNSILQCLYYSVPFRESVINYPTRSPIETLNAALATNLHYPKPDASPEDPLALAKQKTGSGQVPAKSPATHSNQLQKPDDKDSPEYKKKIAMSTLPLLETTNNATSYGMKESLFTSLKDIFEAVVASHERMGVIRPYHFLEVLRREHEMFRTAMHQDAHEFLNLLLNEVVANVEAEARRLPIEGDEQSEGGESSEQATTTTGSVATTLTASNGSKSPNTTRWVHELFEGTLTSETQCLTCEKVSQRDEVFLDLSVDLDQHSSVTSCLRKFSEEEMLCERNKFHCDNCGGLQEAEKRMKIKRLPKILALHLKRFKYTEDLQRLQKLFHRVVYPYHLRLFNTTDDAEDPDRLYELYAVVVHIGGGPYHGHYVAIIKTQDRGWLLFDDEMVEPVDKNYVRNFFGDRPGLACAYVLFYQETTFEAMQREQEQENMPKASSEAHDTVPPLSEHKMNGTAVRPDINRAHSTAPEFPNADQEPVAPLARAPTAPQLCSHQENAIPSTLPPLPATPKTPLIPIPSLGSKKSDVQAKKERAKEEKERKAVEKAAEKERERAEKAAEKEREKAAKQKRRDAETRTRDLQKRQDAEMKAALEASKATKAEEDKRTPSATKHGKENGSNGGLGQGLRGFKLSGRSLSYHKSSGRDKDKDKGHKRRESNPPPPVPPILTTNNNSNHNADTETHQNDAVDNATHENKAPPFRSPVPTYDARDPSLDVYEKPVKQATPKRSRFSLRKKSFTGL